MFTVKEKIDTESTVGKPALVTEEISNRLLGKVTFPTVDFLLPLNLSNQMEVDKQYILTCFWTNAYITYEGASLFRVDNTYGDPIQVDREMLLINPAY